jgi:hypothetical protein
MASDDRVRLEVAFDGGQAIAALVTAAVADELQRALDTADGGVFELEAEDGRYIVALRRVVYVKRFSRETRIGFGAVS